MILRQLYSNQPDRFELIKFQRGINVVLAESLDKKNKKVDLHNLGKSTLGQVIDFCLIKGTSPNFFMEKHPELFEKFVFFLTIEHGNANFLTVRRSPGSASRIWIHQHSEPRLVLTDLPGDQWSHPNLPFQTGRQLLDDLLGFAPLDSWSFRAAISYLIRSQEDYGDVFRLGKHRGRDVEWKPQLAQMLGLPGNDVRRAYELDERADQIAVKISGLNSLVQKEDSLDKVGELISAKQDEIRSLRAKLEKFDFGDADSVISEDLVEETEREIASLNNDRYYLQLEIQQLQAAVDRRVTFNPGAVDELFRDAGVELSRSFVTSHEALVKFHKAVTKERARYLHEQSSVRADELTTIELQLTALNEKRTLGLDALREHKSIEKYRKLSLRDAEMQGELRELVHRQHLLSDKAAQEQAHQDTIQERYEVSRKIKFELDQGTEIYTSVKREFRGIVKRVTNRVAVLSSSVNAAGNIDFQAEFTSKGGTATSEDEGHSYKKFLCIAFDLALLLTHRKAPFPRFAFHDGVFESLDERRKVALVQEMKASAILGIQHIITALETDIPRDEDGKTMDLFDAESIVLRLNDLGDKGRLFKMPRW